MVQWYARTIDGPPRALSARASVCWLLLGQQGSPIWSYFIRRPLFPVSDVFFCSTETQKTEVGKQLQAVVTVKSMGLTKGGNQVRGQGTSNLQADPCAAVCNREINRRVLVCVGKIVEKSINN